MSDDITTHAHPRDDLGARKTAPRRERGDGVEAIGAPAGVLGGAAVGMAAAGRGAVVAVRDRWRGRPSPASAEGGDEEGTAGARSVGGGPAAALIGGAIAVASAVVGGAVGAAAVRRRDQTRGGRGGDPPSGGGRPATRPAALAVDGVAGGGARRRLSAAASPAGMARRTMRAEEHMRAELGLWIIRGAGIALGAAVVYGVLMLGIAAASVPVLLFIAILLAAALAPIVGWLRARVPVGRGPDDPLVNATFVVSPRIRTAARRAGGRVAGR